MRGGPRSRPSAENCPTERLGKASLLAGICSELLGVERISAYDSFFDLGGHSLQGIRVMSRLRETLGVDVPVGTLLAAPTLEALAAAVADALVAQIGEEEVAEILDLSSLR